MNARRLLLLTVVAIVLVASALWLLGERRIGQELADTGALLPELMAQINEVDRIVLGGAGGRTPVTIERGQDTWSVAQRNGFDADAAKIRALLLALARAQRIEAKTANPELHGRLGVEDLAAEDATGIGVEIGGVDFSHSLIVGHGRTRGKGSYVRLADQPQAWLVDVALAPERDPARWIERDLVDIAIQRIATVQIEHADGTGTQIRSRDDGRRFELADLPPDRQPESDYAAEASAGLLASLRIDDVHPADAAPGQEQPRTRARFTTVEGIVIELEGWQDEGRTYARLDAGLDEALAAAYVEAFEPAAGAEAEAEAEAEAGAGAEAEAEDGIEPDEGAAVAPTQTDGSAPRRTLDDLRAEAARLDARFEGWVFELPGFKGSNLMKTREDYLAPRE
ncbi:MAG TPA: DUF4340 domain-containing protein [Xanthomonadaceae bacterium]|nr:DUF4340 domain-containing protein [Xanthomonadaceae bacterium]